jgi:ribonuclease P protein component
MGPMWKCQRDQVPNARARLNDLRSVTRFTLHDVTKAVSDLEHKWVSQHTILTTPAVFESTGFERGWKQNGVVRSSVDVARRDARVLRSNFRQSTPAPSGERFPRHCRLTRSADIARINSEGKRERTPWFEVRALPTMLEHARIAIVVPRFNRTAAARNRVKRRLRELARRELLPSLKPVDVVIRATPSSYRATFDTLRTSMRDLAQRLPFVA